MVKKDNTVTGESRKKFIKADLRGLGLSTVEGSYLTVNTDGASYKIKTNFTGERKKIHLSKEVYNLLVKLVNELENESN